VDLTPYIQPLITIVLVVAALKLLEALLPAIRDALGSGSPRAMTGPLPYRLRDDFLSPAEHSFFLVLRQAVADWAIICPKVSLGDLFYAQTGSRRQNASSRSRIDRKHVDFVLCHPETLRPLVAVELDDGSHQRPDRQRRDRFVANVFSAAGLPLARLPVRYAYSPRELGESLRQAATGGDIPTAPEELSGPPPPATDGSGAPPCPKCGRPMVQRTAKRGGRSGTPFWGCPDYPHCRGVRGME